VDLTPYKEQTMFHSVPFRSMNDLYTAYPDELRLSVGGGKLIAFVSDSTAVGRQLWRITRKGKGRGEHAQERFIRMYTFQTGQVFVCLFVCLFVCYYYQHYATHSWNDKNRRCTSSPCLPSLLSLLKQSVPLTIPLH